MLITVQAWLAEFEAPAWDRQLTDDIAAGPLDALADEARRAFREGGTAPR